MFNPIKRTLMNLSGFFAGMGLLGVLVNVSSCDRNDPNAERNEYIQVFQTQDQEEPLTTYSVGVLGGEFSFYVKSNVEFSAAWQDDASSPWASVKDVKDNGGGNYVVTLQVSPRSTYAYYTRRTGTLMLTSPENMLGTFVTVNQGLYARLSSDFSWSKYGSADPRRDDGTAFSSWSQTNLDRGWGSTKIEGTDGPYLYGKNGYLLLGDAAGHGADLLTPYVNDMVSDSLAVLSFRAVAYTDLEGNKDANKLSIEIIGGGVLRGTDNTTATRLDIDLPYYDMNDESFPNSMWNGSDFLIGLESTAASPLSGNTRIRFTAGDMSGAAGTPNRVFIDNVYIRRIAVTKTYADEDLWVLNGGNGADKLLGAKTEESSNQ